MQSFNVELLSRLFLLNLAKTNSYFLISDQITVPTSSNQAVLEPPTPPRTPNIASNQTRSAEKNCNNNNDDAKENNEEKYSLQRISPIKFISKSARSESDFEDFHRRPSQFNDDSNFSYEERGGRESVVSESMKMNGEKSGDESDREESDCASSFDESKLSLKNIENFLDKSPMVRMQIHFRIQKTG